MKLIGSVTSPYVRRIRLFLLHQGFDYEFINLDIFSEQDRKFLTNNNPTLKVPALIDDDITVYDSRVIFRYLTEKLQLPAISWHQENTLTLIDAANDSLVSLLLSSRSDLPVESDVMFFNLQRQRLTTVFAELEKETHEGRFDDWHYISICLFALLDWVQFRTLFDLRNYKGLLAFYNKEKSRVGIAETDPRLLS